jgi:hypothetical protein
VKTYWPWYSRASLPYLISPSFGTSPRCVDHEEKEMTKEKEIRTRKIRDLNDALRRSFKGGRILMTHGVNDLTPATQRKLLRQVRGFDMFTKDNDPYGEHDFGAIDLDGEKFYWKIDYYTPDLLGGSADPSDPAQTCRVLTLMLASEY